MWPPQCASRAAGCVIFGERPEASLVRARLQMAEVNLSQSADLGSGKRRRRAAAFNRNWNLHIDLELCKVLVSFVLNWFRGFYKNCKLEFDELMLRLSSLRTNYIMQIPIIIACIVKRSDCHVRCVCVCASVYSVCAFCVFAYVRVIACVNVSKICPL